MCTGTASAAGPLRKLSGEVPNAPEPLNGDRSMAGKQFATLPPYGFCPVLSGLKAFRYSGCRSDGDVPA